VFDSSLKQTAFCCEEEQLDSFAWTKQSEHPFVVRGAKEDNEKSEH
jgi:hypothetical protein